MDILDSLKNRHWLDNAAADLLCRRKKVLPSASSLTVKLCKPAGTAAGENEILAQLQSCCCCAAQLFQGPHQHPYGSTSIGACMLRKVCTLQTTDISFFTQVI
jgi:hypothetical protein